jgi:DNA repair exonuclease SbcCD ATPase subunit
MGERSRGCDQKCQKSRYDREKKELLNAQESLKNTKSKHTTLQRDLTQLQNQIESERQTIRTKREAFIRTQSEIQSKISAQKAIISSLKEEIGSREVLLGRSCPKCGQKVGHSVKEWVRERKTALVDADKELVRLNSTLDSLDGEKEQLETLNRGVAKKNEEFVTLQTNVSSAAQRSEKALRTVGSAETALATSEAQVSNLIEETNHIKPQLDAAKTKLRSLQKQLGEDRDALKTAAKRLEDEKILDSCFGPKGAKLLLLDMVVPSLNSEALRLCDFLKTALNVTFNVRTDEQSYAGAFEVNVDNPTGAPDYRGDSSGERRRVDLIILFALLRLAGTRGAKSYNQAIFDEPFENLDESGQDSVLNLLADEAEKKSSTFVITHSAFNLAGSASKVWTVRKGGKIEF